MTFQARKRNKNAVIDYSVNLRPPEQAAVPKKKRKARPAHQDPAIQDAVLNVGLPPASSAQPIAPASGNASSVSLPLPRSNRRGPAANSNVRGMHAAASQSATALPSSQGESSNARPAPMTRQQSNMSARSLAIPPEETIQADAEIRAAMTRHDVYEGALDVFRESGDKLRARQGWTYS
jgi:hypothetical protein